MVIIILLTGQRMGFIERNYTLFENQDSSTRLIEFAKDATIANTGPITITLQYETLQHFRDNNRNETGFDLEGLDSAESNLNGSSLFFSYFSLSVVAGSLPDDFLPTPMSLTIPPSTGREMVTFETSIINDDIHESEEAYFIIAQITFANSVDLMALEPLIDIDTALIRIENDDSKFFLVPRM